ncbi:Clp protease N-terminal domain-containing protein [Streptomyces specialis]|uniref:Clp protease N-terminal domain-containing protein n=1 Tax=Streptomyces specialis TaxID=498367 RepID=UPI00073F855B|nr:Clp protease N-terminal domain-containing protein [Streptomyces specialis]
MGLRNAVTNIRIMNELFTTAEREARALGDEVPGAEHLLLAALTLREDDTGRRAFAAFGVTADGGRGAVGAAHAAALGPLGIDATTARLAEATPARAPRLAPYRSTGTLREVFQQAAALSKKARPGRLRGAHIVLAVTDLRHGTAARVLERLGIEPAALADAAGDTLGIRD